MGGDVIATMVGDPDQGDRHVQRAHGEGSESVERITSVEIADQRHDTRGAQRRHALRCRGQRDDAKTRVQACDNPQPDVAAAEQQQARLAEPARSAHGTRCRRISHRLIVRTRRPRRATQ